MPIPNCGLSLWSHGSTMIRTKNEKETEKRISMEIDGDTTVPRRTRESERDKARKGRERDERNADEQSRSESHSARVFWP